MPRTMEWAASAAHLGGIPRKLVITAVGAFAKMVSHVLNTTTIYNPETLLRLVKSIPLRVPLITVSNHMSTLDDPVMWGFPQFPIFNTKLDQWVLAVEDICFRNSLYSYIFRLAVDAKLTSKALVWGSQVLHLDDVISVSYNVSLRHFTVHSFPLKKASCGLSCFVKSRRSRKDYHFVASSVEEAVQWVGGFADQQCFVNCLPHPLLSSKKQASSELFHTDTPPELLFRCKTTPKMLVILNPRSGRGRSTKVFHGIVEPIFKLAGFRLEVVKTTSAGHARNLTSSVDISTCLDGIICVGGDEIINEENTDKGYAEKKSRASSNCD